MKTTKAFALTALFTACATVRTPPSPARFVAPSFDLRGARSLDATRWVWGSLRAEVTDDRVTLATSALDATILAATETPSGWAFVDARGRVSRARTFLGETRDLGAVPASEDLSCSAAPGRIACLANATLWTTDGSVAPAVVDPGCGALLSDAFVDARFGAVICEGGAVSSTRDGGRSWTLASPPRGQGFRTLRTHQAALIAEAVELAARVDADGSLAEIDVPPTDYETRRDEVSPRVIAAASARFPGHWERLSTTVAAQRRDDGTFVWIDPNHYFASVFRQDDGAARQGRDAHFTLDHFEELAAWGPALGLSQHGALLRAREGVDFEPVVSLEGLRDLRLSDDGVHAIAIGRCPRDSTDASLCTLDRIARWHSLARVTSPTITLGMHGALALVAVCRDPAPSRTCDPVVVDTEYGTTAVVATDALEGALAPDGTAVILIAPRGRDHGAREVAIGSLDAALTRRPLPDGALAVAFADRLRGVAVGATTDHVWRTRDGAVTWERLEVPARVLAPHTPLLEDGPQQFASWSTPLAMQLQCDARRCQLTGRLSLVGWGAMEPSRPAAFEVPLAPRRERPQTNVSCVFDADRSPPPPQTEPRAETDVLDELPLPRGETLRRRDLGPDAEEVSLLAADGQTRWSRRFYFDGMHTSYALRRWRLRGLALRGTTPGFAVESEGARPSLRFFPLTGPAEPAIELPAPSLHAMVPCGAPRREGVSMRVITPDAMPTLSVARQTRGLGYGFGGSSEDPRVLAVIEASGEALCLRELRHLTRNSWDGGRASLRAHGGRIVGEYSDGDGTHPLRCEVDAPAR